MCDMFDYNSTVTDHRDAHSFDFSTSFPSPLAMKQYRRSRPEASREGVRRAKAILEGEKETGTGRRVLNSHGGIPSHPLLRRIEVEKIKTTLGQPSGDLSAKERQQQEEMTRRKIADLQKRQDFLRAMANFRPKETVFEAFATGGGQKDVIHSATCSGHLNTERRGSRVKQPPPQRAPPSNQPRRRKEKPF